MSHLTEAQIAQLEQQLREKLAKLRAYQGNVVEESPVNDPDRLSSNEASEESLETYGMLASETLEGETGAMIEDVEAALARIADGTYGIDEETGEPIPFARLQLFPEARTNPHAEA